MTIHVRNPASNRPAACGIRRGANARAARLTSGRTERQLDIGGQADPRRHFVGNADKSRGGGNETFVASARAFERCPR
ncbi:hypothetical protein WS73_09695 [Burkholderia savannae]|nr:hypothetical protein WS91_19575 [Burkholderia sp. MSMB1498]KWZ48717.1 hypothetical protein WS73_09695 [Burkholderia savannae]